MRHGVHVKFANNQEFQIELEHAQAMERDEARGWLDTEFTRLECEPLRASGKLLSADKVLCIAQAAGTSSFENSEWALSFGRAALATLGKVFVKLDTESMTVSY